MQKKVKEKIKTERKSVYQLQLCMLLQVEIEIEMNKT